MPRSNFYIALLIIAVSLACYSRTSIEEQIFHYTLQKVEDSALEPVERESLFDGALDGMLRQTADYPYSAYLAPDEEAEYEEEIQGRLAGIGVFILGADRSKSPRLWIAPFHDSPADEANLRFGDRIAAADGVEFAGLNLREISEKLRGDEGTEVTLSVIGRESLLETSEKSPEEKEKDATRTVTLTRRLIQQDIVTGDRRDSSGEWIFTLEKNERIGYVRIDQFTETTGNDFLAALEQLDGKIDAFILDLRGNPGGFLPAAIVVADPFLADGDLIVTTRRRDGKIKGEFFASDGKKYDWPIVVLIDGGSASASEIVSAALSDHKRATLLGERSYGKGTVQELFPLPCSMGMLRLTDASFWRPSARPIHRRHDAKETDVWGVTPDIAVPVSIRQSATALLYRDIRTLAEYGENFDTLNRLAGIRLDELAAEGFEEEDEDGEPLDGEQETSKEPAEKSPDEVKSPNESETPDGSAPYFDPVLERAIGVLSEEKPH